MRVVVDTSTTFSALAFNGVPARVLEALYASEEWEIAISVEMRDELQRVLTEKGKDSPEVLRAVQRYFALCVVVTPTQEIHLRRDANDDFILDCAIEAQAALVITSDPDLLVLSRHPMIKELEVIDVREAQRRFVRGVGTARP